MKRLVIGMLACGLLAMASTASAADPRVAASAPNPHPTDQVLVQKVQRASKLMGAAVKNQQGEKLGSIDDFVLNMDKGDIQYVALGVGGVLGVGEKLFAVPFHELKVVFDRNEMYFVLNVSKEKLEQAPGFDKSNWPDFADPKFTEQIDQYYHRASTTKAEHTEVRR